MYCGRCGHPNVDDASFCSKCGAQPQRGGGATDSAAAIPAPMPQASVPSRAQASLATAGASDFDSDAFAAAVGKSRADYYVPRFNAMRRDQSSWSWHWPAFFVTWYWFLYRKMWGWAVLYFLLPLLLALPLGALIYAFEKQAGVLYVALMASFWFVPPLLANRLYYRHCSSLVSKVSAEGGTRERVLAVLEAKGGTSNAAAIVVGIFVLVALVRVLAAIALPAYQDYTFRARVSQRLVESTPIRVGVAEHYARTGQLPETVDEYWARPTDSAGYLRDVTMDPQNGTLELVIKLDDRGRVISVFMAPSADDKKVLAWECKSRKEAHRYVPLSCRNE